MSQTEKEGLDILARRTGKTHEEVIHDLIQNAVAQVASAVAKPNWKEAMRKAKGIWKDRTDIPDLRELREGWGRRASE